MSLNLFREILYNDYYFSFRSNYAIDYTDSAFQI